MVVSDWVDRQIVPCGICLAAYKKRKVVFRSFVSALVPRDERHGAKSNAKEVTVLRQSFSIIYLADSETRFLEKQTNLK